MENLGLYQDIANRTEGDIYVGVVRTSKNWKINLYQTFYGFACHSKH